MTIALTFYGVRGSFPCPYEKYMEYGGSTPCIEIVNSDGDRLIIDAGIGIGRLAMNLKDTDKKEHNLLFTHYHLDHITGLPSFAPFYDKNATINIYASKDALSDSLDAALRRIYSAPLFPVDFDDIPAKLVLNNFTGFDAFKIGRFNIKPYALPHPGGSCGYRVSFKGKVVAIVFDTTHEIGRPNPNVLALMKDADIVIYDANFTDSEFLEYQDYGHSTWQEGVRLMKMAGAKKYVVFHHSSSKDDEKMRQVEAEIKKVYFDSVISKENMRIEI